MFEVDAKNKRVASILTIGISMQSNFDPFKSASLESSSLDGKSSDKAGVKRYMMSKNDLPVMNREIRQAVDSGLIGSGHSARPQFVSGRLS